MPNGVNRKTNWIQPNLTAIIDRSNQQYSGHYIKIRHVGTLELVVPIFFQMFSMLSFTQLLP